MPYFIKASQLSRVITKPVASGSFLVIPSTLLHCSSQERICTSFPSSLPVGTYVETRSHIGYILFPPTLLLLLLVCGHRHAPAWRAEDNFLQESGLFIHYGFQTLNLSYWTYMESTFTPNALSGPSTLFFELGSFPEYVCPFLLDYLTSRPPGSAPGFSFNSHCCGFKHRAFMWVMGFRTYVLICNVHAQQALYH